MLVGNKRIDESFAKVRSVSRFLKILFTVALLFLGIGVLVFVSSFVLSVLLPNVQFKPNGFDLYHVIPLAFFLAVSGCSLLVLRRIFKDIASGSSPFSRENAKRIRWVSYLLIIDVLVELVLSPGFGVIVHMSGVDVGYIASGATQYPILPVNFGALVGSVIGFCLSVVFEYGYLLQRLSDETI